MRTIIFTIAGYIFLLGTVRVLARRPGAQMTPFEFVIVFLLGGVIILATVGDDHSMTNCFCAVIAAGLMHRIVSFLRQRFSKIGRLVDGTPLLLLDNGVWQTEVLGRMRIQDTDVMAAARTKGIRELGQIRYAVLERNGSISVIAR